MKKLRLPGLAATVVLSVALAGCASDKWGFPYKAPIQQGNWITQEQVALLQPGMTREQVRFALGSPTLTSILHADRWDYPYYYKPGYGDAKERKFTVFFQSDHLLRWEGDAQPDKQPFQIADKDAKNAKKDASELKIDDERAKEDLKGSDQELILTPYGDAIIEGDAIGDFDPEGIPGSAGEPLR